MLSRILTIRRIQKMGHRILCPILFFEIVFLVFVFMSQPAFADISDDFNRKGIEKMGERNYREAIIYFESAYKSDPENAIIKKNLSVAYHNIAISFSADGELVNAIRNEKQALKYDPENDTITEQLAIFYNNYGLECAGTGNFKTAIENLEYSMEYSPNSTSLSNNLYNALLQYADHSEKKKNYRKALRLGSDAIKLLPDLSPGYVFMGNIYYNQDNFVKAMEYWDMALERDPENDGLNKRIEKLARESSIEEAFETKKKSYFRIRFDRELDSNYVGSISEILKEARNSVRKKFGFYSYEIVPVVVYADEQFQAATNQPHWTQGLYDGKIRLKSQDISRGNEILKKVLFHEYAHAIIYLKYGNNIPIWLHEGFAQFNEPDQGISSMDIEFIAAYIKENGKFSLGRLDGMFAEKFDQETIRVAYIQSKIFFIYLIDEYSTYKIKRLLKELEMGMDWQEALKKVYHKNIARIDRDFNNYLSDLLK